MSKLILVLTFNVILLMSVSLSVESSSFACGSLYPLANAVSGPPSLSFEAPIQLLLSNSDNRPTNIYRPGDYIIVQLKFTGNVNIKSFVIQASKVMEESPIGSWKMVQPLSKLTTNSCINKGDTLLDDGSEITSYEPIRAFWYPPPNFSDSIEFLASAVDVNGNYWVKWNSFQLSTY